jgi:hypothetical protein
MPMSLSRSAIVLLPLGRLGDRESGTTRLAEAITVFDAALPIFVSWWSHQVCRNLSS